MTSRDTSAHPIDQALRELLPRLRRFALWLTRDASTADDLVQSTIERALSRWSSRHDDDALRPWLFAILYRQFLDGKRRAKRYGAMLDHLRAGHRGADTPDHSAASDAAFPSAEREVMAQAVLQSLMRLPTEQRALLLWVSVEGLSYREVAAMLDVPIGTVMSRLSRARQALRRASDGEAPAAPLRLVK
jgi:RNA polymerase sigma-70 factor (ECF subfamily)